MDGVHSHTAQLLGFLDESKPDQMPANSPYGCCGWDHHSCHPLGQIAELRSKIATLECRVVECQKEKHVAQVVNNYLLRSIASVEHERRTSCTCKAAASSQTEDSSNVEGDIKNILKAILSTLHKSSSAGSCDYEHFKHNNFRTSPGTGNLIDLEEEQPLPQALNAVEGTFKQACVSTGVGFGEKPMDPLGENGAEIGLNQPEDLLSFDADSFIPPSYLTHFSHDRGPATSLAAVPETDHPDASSRQHIENFDRVQSSLDGSIPDLDGSTQYDAFESASAGTTTSPNSSFHHSEDENDQMFKVKKDSVDAVSVLGKSVNVESPEDTIFLTSGTAERTTPMQDNENPASCAAALFLPRWLATSFAMEDSVRVHRKDAETQEHQFPDLFRIEFRFRPDPTESDLYRTVVISRIPQKSTIATLFQHIRGALVFDAKLLDTSSIDDHLTAFVVFVHEHEARAFEHRTRLKPLLFLGSVTRVVLLPTPTWPMSPNLCTAITHHRHTRCLELQNLPWGFKPSELHFDLRICRVMTTHRLEGKKMRSDGVLELRFTSIQYARQAYWTLTTYKRYTQCKVNFSPDPCAESWDALAIHSDDDIDVEEEPSTTNTAAVTCWKDNAQELHTKGENLDKPRMETLEDPEDCTARLSVADPDMTATTQRGRGFTSKEPIDKSIDTCQPQ